jgi:hypothetical protein
MSMVPERTPPRLNWPTFFYQPFKNSGKSHSRLFAQMALKLHVQLGILDFQYWDRTTETCEEQWVPVFLGIDQTVRNSVSCDQHVYAQAASNDGFEWLAQRNHLKGR